MNHQFERQQVSPRHHVPGTSVPQAADQPFDSQQVEFEDLPGTQAGDAEKFGQLGDFGPQISRSHNHVRPQQFLIVIIELRREIDGERGGKGG
jgi:hypothetical protein